jgi:hypothetical protein
MRNKEKTCQTTLFSRSFIWQGHNDSNAEPMDLESTTLPIELYPYVGTKLLYTLGVEMSIPFLNNNGIKKDGEKIGPSP